MQTNTVIRRDLTRACKSRQVAAFSRKHYRDIVPDVRELRLPGETDESFRDRADRSVHIAGVLVAACLANRQIQRLIELGELSEDTVRRSPMVRVEFEQAFAIGGIGETLDATKHKHWGSGPSILPLESDDEFFVDRITYVYLENSLYNRRFEQRQRLKELLGQHRPLVEYAKCRLITKAIFLRDLTARQADAIRTKVNIDPGMFWRACRGRVFLDLPPRQIQGRLFE